MLISDGTIVSTPVKMENGVKQGGVLSPTLFCIYFDELLRRLRETDVGCHVGHMSYAALLTKDMCDDADIRAKRGEFIGSVNRLNVQFRVVPDQIRIRLLQTYCTAWYGCQTWLLNTNHVKGMTIIEWKKAMRRTLNLPRMTRSKLIPLLAGNCSFQEQHESRCGALYASMMQSDNMFVHYMARRAMYNVLGTLGMNRVILRHKFGVPRENGIFNYQYTVCEQSQGKPDRRAGPSEGWTTTFTYVAM